MFRILHGKRKDAAARRAFYDGRVRHRPCSAPVVRAARNKKYPVLAMCHETRAARRKGSLAIFCRGHPTAHYPGPFSSAVGGRYQHIMAVDRIGHRDAVRPVPTRDGVKEGFRILV